MEVEFYGLPDGELITTLETDERRAGVLRQLALLPDDAFKWLAESLVGGSPAMQNCDADSRDGLFAAALASRAYLALLP